MEIKEIQIKTEYITLGQFLKIADVISSGGEAKAFLYNHKVLVNGETDSRRGRKLYKGMTVEVNSHAYKIV